MPKSLFFVVALLGLLTMTNVQAEDAKPAPLPPLPKGVRLIPDIEFAHPDGQVLRLDLYLPPPGARPAPIVLFVHGGGWIWGDRHDQMGIPLTAYGYAVATIDYRLAPKWQFPAQIYDCKAAVRWLRVHAGDYHLNGTRIGAWGASAGGHLVALLGTSGGVKALEGDEGNPGVSSRVQAVCDWFGPSDLLKINTHGLYHAAVTEKGVTGHRVPVPDTHDPAESFEGQLLGGAPRDHKEEAIQASPTTYVSKNDPPFLIMHGDQDWLLPLSQSQIMYAALKKVGANVTFEVIHGAGHGFSGPAIMKTVSDFFDKYLKKQ